MPTFLQGNIGYRLPSAAVTHSTLTRSTKASAMETRPHDREEGMVLSSLASCYTHIEHAPGTVGKGHVVDQGSTFHKQPQTFTARYFLNTSQNSYCRSFAL